MKVTTMERLAAWVDYWSRQDTPGHPEPNPVRDVSHDHDVRLARVAQTIDSIRRERGR